MKKIMILASVFALAVSAHAAQRALFVNTAAGVDTHLVADVDSITFGYNMPVSSGSPRMMYLHTAAAVETVAVDGIDSLTYGIVMQTGASLGVIDSSGWFFVDNDTLTGTYDPYTNPEILAVARHGFDAGGNAVTVHDDVVKMKRLRQPWPDGATATARKVALSDWIFAGDVVENAINNSVLAYPLPNGRWMNPEWEIVENDTLTVRFFAAHAYGRNGTPLACIEFEVTDGATTTPRVLVSRLTPHLCTVSGLTVPCYEADIDISVLNNGVITANAILYPHVGDAPFDVSVDGEPWPSPHYVSVNKNLKASNGAGLRYACVDGIGSGGSEATATNLVTARTTAYAEPMAAIADLENDQGGSLSACVLVLAASTVNRFSRYDTRTVGQIPFYITGEGSGASRAVYTLPDSSAGGVDLSADRLVLDNVIVKQFTPSSQFFNNRAHQETVVKGVSGPLHHRLVVKNTLFDANGLQEDAPWTYVGIVNLYDCESNYADGWVNLLNLDRYCAHTSLVGCRNIGNKSVYWSIGTANRWDTTRSVDGAGFTVSTNRVSNAGVSLEPARGPLFAYNWIECRNNLNCIVSDDSYHGPEGAHYVGNIFANMDAGKDNVLEFYGSAPATLNHRGQLWNVVVQHNTGAGGWGGPRDNKAGGLDPVFYWQFFWRGNIVRWISLSGDHNIKVGYTPDGTQVRNWPQRFGTGFGWAVVYNGDSVLGYDSPKGDALPLHSFYSTEADTLFPGFVHDASCSGTNDHVDGDYAILDDSGSGNKIGNIPRMPAGALSYGYDLLGNAYPMVPADDAGLQTAGALPGGVQSAGQ